MLYSYSFDHLFQHNCSHCPSSFYSLVALLSIDLGVHSLLLAPYLGIIYNPNPKQQYSIADRKYCILYSPLQSNFPLLTCPLQSCISVGIAKSDANRIPVESAKPIEPILNSRACRVHSRSFAVEEGGVSGGSWFTR